MHSAQRHCHGFTTQLTKTHGFCAFLDVGHKLDQLPGLPLPLLKAEHRVWTPCHAVCQFSSPVLFR